MVSSTEIPKAILKTNSVDGFNGMPNQPIIPAVHKSGIKFGIKETNTMRQERNRIAIKMEIARMAKSRLVRRFHTMYFVPLEATMEVPVKVISKYSKSIDALSCSLNSA